MQHPMINHRGPIFADLQTRILSRLRAIFQTKNDILMFPSSGTGGLESAVANMLSPGDRVVAGVSGSFGERFADMAAAFGAQVERLTVPLGSAIEPDALAQCLRGLSDVRAVLLTHSETSTGILNPLGPLSEVVHANSDALVVVDAVSSLGATPFDTDAWGIDVAITGPQKALMCPPGAAIVAISQRAWTVNRMARNPRFYFDWQRWLKPIAQGQTPFTPPISLYFALDVALDMILQEGLANVYARHERVAEMARRRALSLGFSLLADPRYASPTVTAIRAPEGVDASAIIKLARDEYQVEFAGGFGELKGKLIRIGHLGYVNEADITDALDALEKAMREVAPAHAG